MYSHHKERLPVAGRAAVEKPRDIGVLQRGEDLALGPEPGQHLVGVHAALDELERDPLLEGAVRSWNTLLSRSQ